MSDAESNASEQSIKRKVSPSMTSSKESSSRNQSRSNIVPVRCSGKEKKQNKDATQQDDTAEVLKTINKHLQEKSTIFSGKVQKAENEIFGDMVAPEMEGLSCSILKVKFKHKVNNLIFKYRILNLQQNAQPISPHPTTTQHLSAYNFPFSKECGSIHAEHEWEKFRLLR